MSIKKARNKIRKTFMNDPQFKHSYVANIAMLIYGDQIGIKGEPHTITNLSDVMGCNSMAERIIDLIFSS